MAVKIRSVYDPVPRVQLDCRVLDSKTGEYVFHPGRTKQADRDSCDINKILERFELTGQLPDMITRDPVYGDFADVPSYQESLNVVSMAHEQFAALSAKVREHFHNDPAEMLEFCSDPANGEEMVKLGLAVKRPESSPPSQPAPGDTGAAKSGNTPRA